MKKNYKYNYEDEPSYRHIGFWLTAIPVVALIIGSTFWTQGNDNALVMPHNEHYNLTRPTLTSYSPSRLHKTAQAIGKAPKDELPYLAGYLNKIQDEGGKTIYNFHAKGLPEVIRVDNLRKNTTSVYLYEMKNEYGTLGKRLYQGKLAK